MCLFSHTNTMVTVACRAPAPFAAQLKRKTKRIQAAASGTACKHGLGRHPSGRCRAPAGRRKAYVRKMVPGHVRKTRSDKGTTRGPRGPRKDYTCQGGRGRYAAGHSRAGHCKPAPKARLRDQPGYKRKRRSDWHGPKTTRC